MKRITLALAALLFFALGAGPKAAPVVYDLTPVLTQWDGSIAMMGGKTLKLRQTWGAGAQVQFVDFLPTANWRHPAEVRVVKNGQVLETVKTDMPPRDLKRANVLSGNPAVANDVTFKLNDFGGRYRVADPEHQFVVLINGHADRRHWNDFSFLYRTLTQIYGFHPENIFVADSAFKEYSPDLDGNGTNDIQYPSTLAGLKEMMGAVKSKVTSQDSLLLAVNDHGGTTGSDSTIVLYDGEITSKDFAPLLNSINAKQVISMFEQCYSGGFVRPTLGERRVSMSAATNNEYSWASRDLNFDEWIFHAIAAFARQYPDGTPVNSDTNGDGKISVQEAFAFSAQKDAAAESPVLESSSNSGDAANMGIGF